jgi:dihydrofolate synthase/folylpolyglutamate synthase
MPALVGAHQSINAGTAVAAALALPQLAIGEDAIAAGLQGARWPARMQRLGPGELTQKAPADWEIWLDGGHNPAAGEVIARALADLEERAPRPLALVVGMMGHKDAEGFLRPFAGLARRMVAVPIPGAHQPAATPEALALVARGAGISSTIASSLDAAFALLRREEKGPLRVLVTGSLYLAGHVLAAQTGTSVQSN